MNTERLIEGAEFLEQLELKAGDEFDINRFIEHDCGTAACALGWMAIHELFGLMEIDDGIKLRHTDWAGFSAAQVVFDITRAEVKWLFLGMNYPYTHQGVSKEMVAARMRWLAAGGTIDTPKEDDDAG